MILIGGGVQLSLSALGYQFPEASDYWDGNWLVIEGAVTHPRGSWRFRDACLTSFEIRQLADWLDGVARGNPDPDLGYFTEPCLEFRYSKNPEPVIDVILAHECAPPWLSRQDRSEGTRLRFLLCLNDPLALVATVRNVIEHFPVRYGA